VGARETGLDRQFVVAERDCGVDPDDPTVIEAEPNVVDAFAVAAGVDHGAAL
jgi:hypothetical protein